MSVCLREGTFRVKDFNTFNAKERKGKEDFISFLMPYKSFVCLNVLKKESLVL